MSVSVKPAYLLLPAPAVALGVVVAMRHGASPMAFAPNVLAMVLGAIASVAFAGQTAQRQQRILGWAAVAACALVGLTLASSGLEGVHRWIRLGPVWLNASMAFSPWVLGAALARSRAWASAMLLALLGLHAVQPDAGQATALGAAIVAITLRRSPLSVLAVLALVAGTWMRADPLSPVDHVERILVLAVSDGPLLAGAAVLALGVLFLPMVQALKHANTEYRWLGMAFGLYFAGEIAMTFVGNFPVPIMGAGAGAVLGWYAMLINLRAGV
ncbi:hypothetical protein LZC95_27850 [Pendulispora brunnea]|uniref:Uncharacterized protein n=1 Tax=Pendulispora brunnea TaxID=2905690 RepID=A0ABZ2JYX3_9BACT